MTSSTEPGPGQALAATGARIPDFFVVGHEKCGTTSLFRMLRQHPQIFMPDLKEPRFFMRDPDEPPPANPAQTPRHHTLDGYLSLFADARPDQQAGEASPQYIRSEQAAERIAAVAPEAKIIALLREPTDFLVTFHQNCVRGLVEDERDLRKAIALEDSRREGRNVPAGSRAPNRLFYCDHVRYVAQLQRFEAQFSREQMLVLIYEDYRRDNDATVRRILRFLEVDEDYAFERTETKRVRKGVRFQGLHRVALAVQDARRRPDRAARLGRTIDSLTPKPLRSAAVEDALRRVIFSVPPPPDEQLMLELRRRFKHEVVALGDYLGRDMVGEWGYDELG
jgi:hypothetical protein